MYLSINDVRRSSCVAIAIYHIIGLAMVVKGINVYFRL